MEKINFKDWPDASTPISADNLNLMQENAENAIKKISIPCAEVVLYERKTITKENTHSGEQILFDGFVYNYGETFEFKDGLVYCNKHAIISVSYNVLVPEASQNFYILLGKSNGYSYVNGASVETGLVGNVISGCANFEIGAGEYITLKLGNPAPFENQPIYNGSNMCVSVLQVLE